MSELPVCRACNRPVVVERERYEVFEGMHWLCFHLAFEHGDFDPDEPCGDVECPWSRIEALQGLLHDMGMTAEAITEAIVARRYPTGAS